MENTSIYMQQYTYIHIIQNYRNLKITTKILIRNFKQLLHKICDNDNYAKKSAP